MTVRTERDGPVTTVVLDRPHARNAVDRATAQALADAFRAFEADEDARVAVLWGAGGTFCAGADLKAMDNRIDPEGDAPMGPSRMWLAKLVIAAVAGHAVAGGLELACWCDLRVMEESAVLGVFCRRFGVPLLDGGTVRLPAIVGLGRALDLILSGRLVGTEEALAMGLLTEVVPAGEHLARALEMAEGLAAFPQETMLADRRAALEGFGLPLADGLALEAQAGPAVFADAVAGAARFAGGEGRGGAGTGV
jgi:enoyl-CoA hydratase